MSKLPAVYLKRHEERRVRAGHPWIYSNEIDVAKSPLSSYEAGDPVVVLSAAERILGTGYINPHCLICVRMVSTDPQRWLNEMLLARRLERALELRERLFDAPYYRLVYGESDALPGLIVDRYADVLAVQLNTAGIERLKPHILNFLTERLDPKAIVLRNDGAARALEGLPAHVDVVLGDVSGGARVVENGAVFDIDVVAGQKTGWYYDQRDNRARLARYVAGQRVLDVFSYAGGFGVQAAMRGAREVRCIDSSEAALAQVAHNAALNGCADRIVAHKADAFAALKQLGADGERFGVVIVDPPAFARRKKDLATATTAYRRLNKLALALLGDGGVLMSASCSSHLPRAKLMESIGRAARSRRNSAQILEQGGQGADHPLHPLLAETEYLKFLVARVLDS